MKGRPRRHSTLGLIPGSALPPVAVTVAVATALGWLEFRGLPDFRLGRPRLAGWFDRFAARASMRATPLSGDTVDAAAASTGASTP
jgi:hypothetical protein